MFVWMCVHIDARPVHLESQGRDMMPASIPRWIERKRRGPWQPQQLAQAITSQTPAEVQRKLHYAHEYLLICLILRAFHHQTQKLPGPWLNQLQGNQLPQPAAAAAAPSRQVHTQTSSLISTQTPRYMIRVQYRRCSKHY